jgi:hypothetical protein
MIRDAAPEMETNKNQTKSLMTGSYWRLPAVMPLESRESRIVMLQCGTSKQGFCCHQDWKDNRGAFLTVSLAIDHDDSF